LAFGLFVACAPSFSPKTCVSDADCANYGTTALVCALEMPPAVCRPASEFPIRVGMSAPATGPSQDLGVEMRKGVLVAFDEANATGGIRGRQLQLDFRDDLYIPDNAEAKYPFAPRCAPGPVSGEMYDLDHAAGRRADTHRSQFTQSRSLCRDRAARQRGNAHDGALCADRR